MLVSRVNAGLSFGRALRENEIAEFTNTVKEGKKIAGQTGNSIFIMPATSLPQPAAVNTGLGNIASEEGIKYFADLKPYLDFNVVENLPDNRFYGNHYDTTSLSLGEQNINPKLLTTPEYGSILTQEEFDGIVKANNTATKETIANIENVMGNGSPQGLALKKAHDRFKALDENSELKQRYNKFVTENADRLSIKYESEPDEDFFKFKQFLATEHRKKGIDALHKEGLKYCSDMALNFTDDEIKAYPKAFKEGYYMGAPSWKMPSLDFDTILDEASDAHKLLKMKFMLAAKDPDMVRIDAAWNYVTPVVTPVGETEIKEANRKSMDKSIVELFEKWFKELKGDAYDPKNLIYEFEADPNQFNPFWEEKLVPALQDRVKIYQTTYMNEGWGSNDAFKKRGWKPEEFCVGVGNHDPQPLRQIANGVADTFDNNKVHKNDSIGPLARILKLDAEALKDPVEFAKAKWAEPMMAKNNHFFFMDVFGSDKRFNMHTCETGSTSKESFRLKAPLDYMKKFHEAIQEGFGFNIMDSLEKVFKSQGYNESHADLYAKIVKFRDILNEKDGGAVNPTATGDVATNGGGKTVAGTVGDAVETAAEQGAKEGAGEVKGGVKAAKSYKPLWIGLGALAVLGGGYAIFRNKFPKPAKHDQQKTQDEPKKVS